MSDRKQGRGRPRTYAEQDSSLDSYAVRLPAKQARIARKLGLGNLSKGIRLALMYAESRNAPVNAKREDNPFIK